LECFFCLKNKRFLKKRSSPDLECPFVPKTSVLLKKKRSSLDLECKAFSKKKVFAGLEAFFCPKNGPGYKSQGRQKSPRGGQNISRGSSYPPTSRAYVFNVRYCSSSTFPRLILWYHLFLYVTWKRRLQLSAQRQIRNEIGVIWGSESEAPSRQRHRRSGGRAPAPGDFLMKMT